MNAYMRRWVSVLLCASALSAAAGAEPAQHVVSLGGDVTEIVYALGEQGRLACDDQTSLYPPEAAKLRQVGYLRALSAEGVLSCQPDLILASEEAGPPAVMSQLAGAGVPLVTITNGRSLEAVATKIAVVAQALGVAERGRTLAAQVRTQANAAQAKIAALTEHPRALFLMAQGPSGAMAAGRDTAADAILTLAGARNVADGFTGYKPLTAEAALVLQPDVILIADYAMKLLGGPQAVRARPEIALTPAGRTGRIVPIDTLLLLGFGPRMPEAMTALAAAVRGDGAPTAAR